MVRMNTSVKTPTTSLRSRIVRTLLTIYSRGCKNHLLPVNRVLWLRRIAGPEKDAIATPLKRTTSTGKDLHNKYLAKALANDELGTWALDVDVLNFLEQEIQTRHPHTILEFGSGISTLCFAYYMQEMYGIGDIPRVYSIEQNDDYAQKIRFRLYEMGLDKIAKIIYAPLHKQIIENIEIECYDAYSIHNSLYGRNPDFIVIDGPAGDDGIRFGTLPLIKELLGEKFVFYLDDALRDGELQIALQWSGLPYLKILGIYAYGKGLLAGCAVHNC
jgi:hypothetical protein